MWTTTDGWPVGVMHRFVWHDGRFWMTCAEQRKRVKALRARPKSAVSITSEGTSMGADINIVAKTLAIVHPDDDRDTKAWFFPTAGGAPAQGRPCGPGASSCTGSTTGRVVIELVPQSWITYDGNRLDAALGGRDYDPDAKKGSHNAERGRAAVRLPPSVT